MTENEQSFARGYRISQEQLRNNEVDSNELADRMIEIKQTTDAILEATDDPIERRELFWAAMDERTLKIRQKYREKLIANLP